MNDSTTPPQDGWFGAGMRAEGFGRRGRGRGRRGPGGFGGPGGGFGGPGGFRGMGGFGGGPFRARRGDVRAAILALLAERPMHGYEIIREIAERTGGAWRPSPGSVYPTLTMLEEEGLVTGDDAEGKRRFTLTDTGKVEVESREGPPPWEEVTAAAPPGTMAFGEAMAATMPAIKQVLRSGTPDQQAKAAEILDDTRRKLYALLAE